MTYKAEKGGAVLTRNEATLRELVGWIRDDVAELIRRSRPGITQEEYEAARVAGYKDAIDVVVDILNDFGAEHAMLRPAVTEVLQRIDKLPKDYASVLPEIINNEKQCG